jgi:hypothetical protein
VLARAVRPGAFITLYNNPMTKIYGDQGARVTSFGGLTQDGSCLLGSAREEATAIQAAAAAGTCGKIYCMDMIPALSPTNDFINSNDCSTTSREARIDALLASLEAEEAACMRAATAASPEAAELNSSSRAEGGLTPGMQPKGSSVDGSSTCAELLGGRCATETPTASVMASPCCGLMTAADSCGDDGVKPEPLESCQMKPCVPPGGHLVDDTVLAVPPGGQPDEPTNRSRPRLDYLHGGLDAPDPGSGLITAHGGNPSVGLMNAHSLNWIGGSIVLKVADCMDAPGELGKAETTPVTATGLLEAAPLLTFTSDACANVRTSGTYPLVASLTLASMLNFRAGVLMAGTGALDCTHTAIPTLNTYGGTLAVGICAPAPVYACVPTVITWGGAPMLDYAILPPGSDLAGKLCVAGDCAIDVSLMGGWNEFAPLGFESSYINHGSIVEFVREAGGTPMDKVWAKFLSNGFTVIDFLHSTTIGLPSPHPISKIGVYSHKGLSGSPTRIRGGGDTDTPKTAMPETTPDTTTGKLIRELIESQRELARTVEALRGKVEVMEVKVHAGQANSVDYTDSHTDDKHGHEPGGQPYSQTRFRTPFAFDPPRPLDNRQGFLQHSPDFKGRHSLGSVSMYGSSKRTSWKKSPIADIADVLPQWEPDKTIQEFHYAFMVALHSPPASRIPDLLAEEHPLDTIMRVVITIQNNNPSAAAHMSNSAMAAAMGDTLFAFMNRYENDISAATMSPFDPDIQNQVADIIRKGLTELRGIYNHTSRQGVLLEEVQQLVTSVSTTPMDKGEENFVVYVDYLWSQCQQLWGDQQSYHLMTTGPLSGFLPAMVERLSFEMQHRAIEFFNDLIRTYQSPEAQRVMPDQLRERLQEALRDYTVYSRPSGPSLHRLAAAWPGGVSYDKLYDLEMKLNRSMGILNVPADLHFVATTGLLLSHWRPFIQRLIGNHKHLWIPRSDKLLLDDAGPSD